ncbi:MAG: OstA-like protein [Bacteroidales bacterium]
MRFQLTSLLLLLICTNHLSAQQVQNEERLIRLIKAKTAESYQSEFRNIRRVTGPAQFFHNNTIFLCDTAIWDLTQNIIDATGNVKIIQNQTVLSGDRIHYIADSSLAKVRGSMVELVDKDSNRLRTLYLDYNTKDSIAFFYNGGSMMDKKGKVIESNYGYYHSKIGRFKFVEKVELNSDSVVLKSDSLAYWNKERKIDFLGPVKVWQNDAFLSSNSGWYYRDKEIYNFDNNAYMLNKDNELWAKKIYYDKGESLAELHDNVQLVDSVQSVIMFSDYVKYRGNPTSAKLYKKPVVAYYFVENDVKDTLFFAADTINYRVFTKDSTDSATVARSMKRYELSLKDPIKEMLSKPAVAPRSEKTGKNLKEIDAIKDAETAKEKLLALTDSVKLKNRPLNLPLKDTILLKDTIAQKATIVPKDTTAQRDTTMYRFIDAGKNVRFFRSNLQGKCDSMEFNSIDSTIRLYKDPVMWNDNNQFSSDSIQIIISGKKLKKTELMSGAFVAAREDSIHYNQIKATDIVAHFNDGDLTRFDAYGGVSILFFFAEDSILTTMNQKECKFMTTTIKEKRMESSSYYEDVPSNLYPIIDLEPEKKRLKGFRLRFDERPASRFDVCDRKVLSSRRSYVSTLETPTFFFTRQLFGISPALPGFEIFKKPAAETIPGTVPETAPVVKKEISIN